MSIALRNKQMLALLIIAILTLLAITFIVLSTMAHIDVLHLMHFTASGTVKPSYMYPGH